jgi:hypothetical protein
MSTAHLEAVHAARQRFAAARKTLPADPSLHDYRAILHVHAEDSNHTGGTREEVLAAAKRTGVRVIFFSDHRGPKPDTWRGVRDGVLFVPGSETGDGFLDVHFSAGKLRFLCHVEERYDAPTGELHGLEMYNRHTDATDEQEFERWFGAAMKNPEEWKRIGADLAKYPDEMFAGQADYWPEIFAKWDRDSRAHALTGVAANDAHHNQRYQGLDFDPYEVSFRNVSTHILAHGLTEEGIRDSLIAGRTYVSHDWLADPTGFRFERSEGGRLTAVFPLAAKLRLIHDGKVIAERVADRIDHTAGAPGVYRVEAWLTVDGEDRPWIYSNQILILPSKP